MEKKIYMFNFHFLHSIAMFNVMYLCWKIQRVKMKREELRWNQTKIPSIYHLVNRTEYMYEIQHQAYCKIYMLFNFFLLSTIKGKCFKIQHKNKKNHEKTIWNVNKRKQKNWFYRNIDRDRKREKERVFGLSLLPTVVKWTENVHFKVNKQTYNKK